MENIVIGFFLWFVVMFLLLMVCPKERIPLITRFFEKILPRLPITGILKAFNERNSHKKP
jgi:hypothetical protein